VRAWTLFGGCLWATGTGFEGHGEFACFFEAGFVALRGPVSRGLAPREARRGRPGASRGATCLLPFPSVVRSPQGGRLRAASLGGIRTARSFFDDGDSDDDGDSSGDDDLLRGPASLTEERSARLCSPRVRRAFFLLFWKRSSFTLLLLHHSDDDEDDGSDDDDEEEEEWRRSALFYLLKSVRRAASYFSLSATSWLMVGYGLGSRSCELFADLESPWLLPLRLGPAELLLDEFRLGLFRPLLRLGSSSSDDDDDDDDDLRCPLF
jgi:hypothetical protein